MRVGIYQNGIGIGIMKQKGLKKSICVDCLCEIREDNSCNCPVWQQIYTKEQRKGIASHLHGRKRREGDYGTLE